MGLRRGWTLFLVVLMVFAISGLVLAQEGNVVTETGNEEMAQEEGDLTEDVSVTFGSVVKVADDQLTILEYDFDADQDVEMNYVLDADTEFENIASAAELKAEDPVEVVFIEMEDQKVALVVKKEELNAEEEPLAEGDEANMEEENLSEDVMPGNEETLSNEEDLSDEEVVSDEEPLPNEEALSTEDTLTDISDE